MWIPISFPSLLFPCLFSYISLCTAFLSSFILQLNSVTSVSILITSVLNSASGRLSVFLLLSSFFWSFNLFFHLGRISLSQHTCCIGRGRALGISQDWVTHFAASWHSLDECFFFNCSVARLPCSLIFWQFWLFSVFRLVVILLLVLQGHEVFLPTPPSWLEPPGHIFCYKHPLNWFFKKLMSL